MVRTSEVFTFIAGRQPQRLESAFMRQFDHLFSQTFTLGTCVFDEKVKFVVFVRC